MVSLLAPTSVPIDRSAFWQPGGRPRCECVTTHRHPSLTDEEVALLLQYAVCVKPLPCIPPLSAGRTIYSRTEDGGSLGSRGIRAVKSKGIQGLVAFGTALRVVPPSPGTSFSDARRAHLMLDEFLRPRVVTSGPRALNSLLATGAANEYEFHNRLASASAGLPPLMAVAFGTDEAPEADCFDDGSPSRRTGGVFLAHDPDTASLSTHLHCLWHRRGDGTLVVVQPAARDLGTDCGLRDLVANFISIYERLARVNAVALFDAGVARHSSVPTNFLINRFSEKVYQTDLDTCIAIDTLPEHRRGPQVVRDVSSTLVKMAGSLCLCAWSEDLADLLSPTGTTRAFRGVLEAYFARFAATRAVEDAAARLQSRFLRYVERRLDPLRRLKDGYVTAEAAGRDAIAGSHQDALRFVMEPFFRDVVLELYLLLKGSRFESAGFALPTLAPATLHAQLTEGVRAYRATILRVATPAAGSIEATPAESTMIAGSSQPF